MRLLAVLLLTATLGAQAEKPLEIRFVDVEGGQATLIVSPSGDSLLVDTDETTAHGLRLSAQRDGSFTVTNDRNGHTRTYK